MCSIQESDHDRARHNRAAHVTLNKHNKLRKDKRYGNIVGQDKKANPFRKRIAQGSTQSGQKGTAK